MTRSSQPLHSLDGTANPQQEESQYDLQLAWKRGVSGGGRAGDGGTFGASGAIGGGAGGEGWHCP